MLRLNFDCGRAGDGEEADKAGEAADGRGQEGGEGAQRMQLEAPVALRLPLVVRGHVAELRDIEPVLRPQSADRVQDGRAVDLGGADGGLEAEAAQQVDGGAGTAGIDTMSKMMQMQFEATLNPEIKKALE